MPPMILRQHLTEEASPLSPEKFPFGSPKKGFDYGKDHKFYH